jgi:serine/threonine protein kinase
MWSTCSTSTCAPMATITTADRHQEQREVEEYVPSDSPPTLRTIDIASIDVGVGHCDSDDEDNNKANESKDDDDKDRMQDEDEDHGEDTVTVNLSELESRTASLWRHDEDEDDDDDDDDEHNDESYDSDGYSADGEDDNDYDEDAEEAEIIEETIFALSSLRYRFTHRIHVHRGVGVYGADDEVSGKRVAVKICIKHSSQDKLPIEARVLVHLKKTGIENVQELLAVHETDDTFVLVSRLHRESSFRKALFGNVEAMTSFMVQLLTTVQAIHAAGVVVRDIKPSNLLWCARTEKLVVIDFDLSTWSRPQGHAVCLGTDGFMSPEVMSHDDSEDQYKHDRRQRYSCRPIPYDQDADIYSMGTVLVSLLCEKREHEFTEDDLHKWRKRMNNKRKNRKQKLSPLETVAMKMTIASAKDRVTDINQLRQLLLVDFRFAAQTCSNQDSTASVSEQTSVV